MFRHNIGRLPVVERNDPGRVVGYLGRSCILAARWSRYQEEEVRERGAIGFLLPGRFIIKQTTGPTR